MAWPSINPFILSIPRKITEATGRFESIGGNFNVSDDMLRLKNQIGSWSDFKAKITCTRLPKISAVKAAHSFAISFVS